MLKTVRIWTILSFALTFSFVASPQGNNSRIPRFEDYPSGEIFNGKPAPPNLARPGDRLFRTKIREGIAKGPNFAGHYSIADWGCGTSCVSIAVVDAKTGNSYSGPFGILGYGEALKYADTSENKFQPLSYNINSRLLIVRGCPEDVDKDCASYFWEWRESAFRLIRKIAAVPIQR
jgi:hypothetical protein